MKSRNGKLALVALALVLVLGVGYAVINSVSLSVTGTAATESKDLDVVINAATPTTGTTQGAVSSPANKSATITVTGMTGTSDSRTVTYTVKNNESDVDAKVYVDAAEDIVVSKSSFFSVTTSITGEANAITVPAGGTETFTVTVGLKKLPVASADSSTDITITITADAVVKS